MALTIREDIIAETTLLFFLYQYSQCMFICYEVFLADYCNNTYGGRYWSYPLLYSICALGARMSPNVEVREKGDLLFKVAKEMLDNQGIRAPSVTGVQAYLCLALYELGRGNYSMSWLFSGMVCDDDPKANNADALRDCFSSGTGFRIAAGPKILG